MILLSISFDVYSHQKAELTNIQRNVALFCCPLLKYLFKTSAPWVLRFNLLILELLFTVQRTLYLMLRNLISVRDAVGRHCTLDGRRKFDISECWNIFVEF